MKKNKENIKVCVRMRPLLKPYEDEEIWNIEKNTIFSRPVSYTQMDLSSPSFVSLKERDIRRRYVDSMTLTSFTFDHIYSISDTSERIYEEMCRPILEFIMQGFNGAVFMYGQTTSGKTYSMLGKPEMPGILPLSIKDVFRIANKTPGAYTIFVSYLEIYNEQINDLLVPTSTNLKIKENNSNVFIQDLSKYEVKSFDQVIMIMNYGEEHRVYRETSIHEHSSRSHTIFKIYVEFKDKGSCKYGCLNLVDLAGSERLNEFEVKAHEQLGETGHINKSLFILANVINKLADGKQQHIPYRDSKLTRILSQALGGNSLSAIICTISPAAMNLTQTISTLRFATRAKNVQNDVHVNELIDESNSAQLKFELLKVKEQLEQSKFSFSKIEQQNRELAKQLQHYIEESKQANENLKAIKSENSDAASRNLLQMLDQERAKRKQLEKEFEQQSVQLMNLIKNYEDLPGGSHPPSEIYFIDNMVITIENELAQELAASQFWPEKSKDLALNYRQEITEIQDQYSTALSELLKESIQINSPNDSVTNEKEIIFYDIQPDFSDVSAEFVAGESFESCTDKLRIKYEQYLEKIDIRYEEARSSLEVYYQNQITKSLMDKNNISSLAAQHSEMLQELKSQNQEIVQEVETRYMNVIKTLSQFTSQNIKENSKEPLGNFASFLTQNKGVALAWGSGKDGRCGTGSEQDVLDAFPVLTTQNSVISLNCGYHHSAAVTSDGKVFTWGRGLFGQLGHGNNEICKLPTQIKHLDCYQVKTVACGWQHSLCLLSNGKLFSWGYGEDGQLGHGDRKDYLTPKEILPLPPVSHISCGHSHSGCVSDNKLFMWGCNPDARCFVTTSESISKPQKINLNRVVSFDLGVNHSAAVLEEGKLMMSGLAQEGQLGVNSSGFLEMVQHPDFGEGNKAVMVACGDGFTLVLNAKGEVFSFGKVAHGRTGRGSVGEVHGTGVVEIEEKVREVNAGCRHAAAVTVSGDLYMWGFNYYHQLGVESQGKDVDLPVRCPIDKVVSVSCGYFHTMAIRAV